MDLIIDHDGLNHFYDLSQNESELLRENMQLFLSKINDLKEVYKGKDAEIFYENVESYFKKLEVIPEFYEAVNNFVIEANKRYKNTDRESKREFIKVAEYNGDKNA